MKVAPTPTSPPKIRGGVFPTVRKDRFKPVPIDEMESDPAGDVDLEEGPYNAGKLN